MASRFCYRFFSIFIAFVLISSSQVKSVCKSTSIKDICDATLFPSSCYNSLNPMISSNIIEPKKIYEKATESALSELSRASLDFAVNGTIEKLVQNDRYALSAVSTCRDLIQLALFNLKNSFVSTQLTSINDKKSWLCAAGADLQTCIDGFDDLVNDVIRNIVFKTLEKSTEYTSNSLAIMDRIERCENPRFKSQKFEYLSGRDPYWLSSNDRRMLKAVNIKPDIIVAKDGTGNYSTISGAIKAAPYNSYKRLVIYVKKGVYRENVKVDIYQSNVMMIGDGMNQTIVSGNLSNADGSTTFGSATFAVFGKGFIARDMGFENTAGAIKRQAVALLSTADQSVFYRCRIEAYQDSLCIHSNRQFYRECYIYGTVDFIFGYGSGVIQKSVILVKKPLWAQRNIITANQKNEPKCNTGFAIQGSVIKSAENLTGIKTYLGRPLTAYSTAVFLQNWMDSLINPKGWDPRNESAGAPPPARTIFFAEYNNYGPGADTRNRVKWPGVRAKLSNDEAKAFTVKSLINGDQWLNSTSVSFNLGL